MKYFNKNLFPLDDVPDSDVDEEEAMLLKAISDEENEGEDNEGENWNGGLLDRMSLQERWFFPYEIFLCKHYERRPRGSWQISEYTNSWSVALPCWQPSLHSNHIHSKSLWCTQIALMKTVMHFKHPQYVAWVWHGTSAAMKVTMTFSATNLVSTHHTGWHTQSTRSQRKMSFEAIMHSYLSCTSL